jgi:hypothetical protein
MFWPDCLDVATLGTSCRVNCSWETFGTIAKRWAPRMIDFHKHERQCYDEDTQAKERNCAQNCSYTGLFVIRIGVSLYNCSRYHVGG